MNLRRAVIWFANSLVCIVFCGDVGSAATSSTEAPAAFPLGRPNSPDIKAPGQPLPKDSGSSTGFISSFKPDAKTGTSTAVVVSDAPLVHTAQLLPLDEKGELVGGESVTKQTEQVLLSLSQALTTANSALSNVVKLNLYLTRPDSLSECQQVLAREFGGPTKPAVSVVIGRLPQPAALVAMDAVGLATEKPSFGQVKQFSVSSLSPKNGVRHAAILPAGPKVYVSGMADTNSLPEATRKTLEKLVGAIGHLNLTKKDIVQLKAFLQPMSELATVRQEIVKFFDGDAPPLVFVEWISPAPNPPIEIELIAAGKGDFSKESDSVTFLTPPGTTSTKVYSRVARVNHGKLVYISGLYGGQSPDAAGQVREIFNSLGEILHETGSDFEHLAKATYYVSDDDASNKLNDLRPKFYNPERPPAASKAKMKSIGNPGKTVTLDMIAVAN
jgi:enamine deaminase RidA (YjgF/YER057c/UK114 family)